MEQLKKNGKVPKEVIMLPWNAMNSDANQREIEKKKVRQYNRKLGKCSVHSVEFGVFFSALESYAIRHRVMATSKVHCTSTSAK